MGKLLWQLLKTAWMTCWAFLDGLVLWLSPSRPAGSRALVVRIDAIGDFVLWSEAGRAIIDFQRAQGRTVVLLGNQSWTGWAEEMNIADEVWGIDRRRFSRNLGYRWSWLKKLRTAGFDVAVGPLYSRDFLVQDSLIRASGAADRIGYDGDCSNIRPWLKKWSDRWYTRLVPAIATSSELKRNATFVRATSDPDFKARVPSLPKHHQGVTPIPTQYAVLFPAASWIGRAWSVDSFAEIGRRLSNDGYHIVVAGSAGDAALTGPLAEALHNNVRDVSGKTSLSELAEVLRGAAAIVTNETSALHIGAAVGTPVICILGGGHYGRFAPYEVEISDPNRPLPYFAVNTMDCFGCGWHCCHSREEEEAVKCIRDISVDDVWRLVETALSTHGSLKGTRK